MKKLLIPLGLLLCVPTVASADYTVKSGDTLWKISRSNNVAYADLIKYNPQITNANVIKIGDKINLSRDDLIEDILTYAKSLQSVTTYVYGGQNAPYQTDCSGWTQHIYGKYGVTLPRVSRQQANVGLPVTFRNMQKGDLMFFSSREDKVVDHVGIYLGNGQWISNLNSKKGVAIYSIWGSWTQQHFLWAQRVI